MRTFCRTVLFCSAALLISAKAPAQTLARPGWAGSGLAAEAWWRTAVFYRIDVHAFQDSTGDSLGDLPGIAQRLGYLQSLGVDAIILQPPFDEIQFDDLLRAASSQHIRLLVALSAADSRDTSALLATARRWLTRGAAGILLPASLLKPGTLAVRELHNLVAAMPGQRVLLALPEAGSGAGAQLAHSDGADLVGLSTDIPLAEPDGPFPAALRRALLDVQTPPANAAPLLYSDNCCRTADAEVFPADPARTLGMNKITATRLLASRGAVALLYGQELGLVDPAGSSSPATMRWTPSNITPPPASVEADPQPPPREDVYGAFRPYVAPKPSKKPALNRDGEPVVDPDTLPGFSSAAPVTSVSRANAATEDTDPRSLLNFYRRLSQLHHGNSSLRTGTPYVLDHDREQALVWIRRAPAGARTAATVIVACNLSGKALTLSLRADFERLHIRPGTLRPLLASWTETPGVQPADTLQLPPFSAFIGELFHER